jgi:hypothetical protein
VLTSKGGRSGLGAGRCCVTNDRRRLLRHTSAIREALASAPPLREETCRGHGRCLVAEDDLLIRELIAALLDVRPGLHLVGQAGTGADGVRLVPALRPDLADHRLRVVRGYATVTFLTLRRW